MTGQPQLRQVGALPWRWVSGRVDILLVTSRETKRWIIPKGWAMAGLADNDAAAQEAREEAGVEGLITMDPIGEVDYDKRRKDGTLLRIRTDFYGLDVKKLLRNWPEKTQRERRWFTPAKAADAVAEPGLAELIVRFSAAQHSAVTKFCC